METSAIIVICITVLLITLAICYTHLKIQDIWDKEKSFKRIDSLVYQIKNIFEQYKTDENYIKDSKEYIESINKDISNIYNTYIYINNQLSSIFNKLDNSNKKTK